MKKLVTGIQSTGKPHLGNIVGAIEPAIELSHSHDSFCFIADIHSLNSITNHKLRKEYTYDIVSTFLALGYNDRLFRQSDIKGILELYTYLINVTPHSMMAKNHAAKSGQSMNMGLFTYPILMTADIVLYDADVVPVGQDQKQHLEICRDIAGKFNRYIDKDIFKLPEALYKSEVIIPGTDGEKMSKSNGNIIDIFADETDLEDQIMSIKTDSTPLKEPKNHKECNVFKLYSSIAEPDEIKDLEKKYEKGGFGYGEAKKILLGKILEKYDENRRKYSKIREDENLLEEVLNVDSFIVNQVAEKKLIEIRKILYSS